MQYMIVLGWTSDCCVHPLQTVVYKGTASLAQCSSPCGPFYHTQPICRPCGCYDLPTGRDDAGNRHRHTSLQSGAWAHIAVHHPACLHLLPCCSMCLSLTTGPGGMITTMAWYQCVLAGHSARLTRIGPRGKAVRGTSCALKTHLSCAMTWAVP